MIRRSIQREADSATSLNKQIGISSNNDRNETNSSSNTHKNNTNLGLAIYPHVVRTAKGEDPAQP